MTFTQLELFACLARVGSFSRTAQQLGISQSAVSHGLRALEGELGVQLFHRDRSAATLTPEGERLLARVHEINALHEALRQDACNARGLQEGALRIASFGVTSSLRILPELLQRFSQEHPGLRVYVDEEDDATVLRWLEERRVEIGFVALPDERFETWQVAQDDYQVLLPVGHPLAREPRLNASALVGQPMVLVEGCGPLISGALAERGVTLDVRHRFKQLLSVIGFVREGMALSISARLALPDEIPGVVCRSLDPPLVRRVGLAVRDARKLSPAAQAFMALAQRMYPAPRGRAASRPDVAIASGR